jgi:penicillin-binding protein 1A
VQGALVSLDPVDGAVVALVGGYDFLLSKYNRATQSRRQPGSSFKPFIYSAALENGFTTASVISDAPVVYDDPSMEEVWRPENYEREFRGPMRLREALVASRNLVSIRVLREVGVGRALTHLERFGFDAGELPRSLSLALGSASLSPMQMASAYAVLSNGGFSVPSYFIDRIEDAAGLVLYEAAPDIACPACERFIAGQEAEAEASRGAREDGARPTPVAAVGPADGTVEPVPAVPPMPAGWPDDAAVACARMAGFGGALPLHAMAPRAVSAQNVYLVTDMMRDVIRRGTGRRAWRELRRADLAGKTGTTNEQRDAWFSGFNADIVATVWVGFDDFSKLGRGEVGGRAALPAWIDYMGDALAGRPAHSLEQPFGLVRVKISPETGMLAGSDDADFIYELFRADNVPDAGPLQATSPFDEEKDDTAEEETIF